LAVGKPSILIVDDEAVNRNVWSFVFREEGFEVQEAASGKEALDLARSGVDLIILDVNLPDLSGFEVCKRIKADPATASASVVHLSAVFKDSHDRTEGLEGGADAYLVKPVDHRELLATVRALLRIRAAEEAARRAAEEWRATFDAITDAVCLLDAEGHIQRCNDALASLLGRTPTEAVGAHLATSLLEALGLREPIPTSGTKEVHASGRVFRVTAAPMRDGSGCVVSFADRTAERQLEVRIQQSQRLESVARLAAGVAHDFNNQLTAVLAATSLLLNQAPPGSSQIELLQSIERSAWRAAELTRQLLGFSRQTLLWLRPVQLAEVLSAARDDALAALPPGARVTLHLPSAPGSVLADSAQLRQALAHLIARAASSGAIEGGIDVRLTRTEGPPPSAPPEARPGPYLLIRLHVPGLSLDADVLSRVFDPFADGPGRVGGAGLGLAWAHGLVRQHEGWIECHSHEAAGTTFDLYLPLTEPTAPGAPPVASDSSPPEQTLLALVADEDDTLRALACAYLRQEGIEPLEAGTSAQALVVLQRQGDQVGAILIDDHFPDAEMVLDWARRNRPELAIVLASASPEALGFPTVSRPYRPTETARALAAALARAGSSTQPGH
jgi:PAS domain S-box-containing protein